VTGGKCCLRIGSAQLTAADCEKSTGTSMAHSLWNVRAWIQVRIIFIRRTHLQSQVWI
jgi:hypothetical protein